MNYKPIKFHGFKSPFTILKVFYKPDSKQEKTEISEHGPFTRLSYSIKPNSCNTQLNHSVTWH